MCVGVCVSGRNHCYPSLRHTCLIVSVLFSVKDFLKSALNYINRYFSWGQCDDVSITVCYCCPWTAQGREWEVKKQGGKTLSGVSKITCFLDSVY